MGSENIVLFLVGLTFLALGVLLSTKVSFATWALSYGRGRIWTKLLGPERALKVTRYFFGPLITVLGLISILGAFATPNASFH